MDDGKQQDIVRGETEHDTDSEVPIDCRLSSYDYDLPEELIAQAPVYPRDHSRLLVVRSPQSVTHQQFFDLPQFLQPGDLLVLNNTRVIPARLYGKKLNSRPSLSEQAQTQSAPVEVFLLEEQKDNQWLTLVRPGRRLRPGAVIQFGPTPKGFIVHGHIRAIDEATGGRIVDFEIYECNSPEQMTHELESQHDTQVNDPPLTSPLPSPTPSHLTPSDLSLWQVLPDLGDVPLPPYISNPDVDAERYQTVYGDRPGAVAAPTAGLHFTPALLEHLTAMGVEQAFITLHVGVGTFRPVEVENITAHQMHGEWIEVPENTVAQIQATKQRGGRVIAVGTTATRALEGAAQEGVLRPFRGKTHIFIYPGYQWQVIDGLITNFHLPKSSLMMMVSALISRPALLSIYEEAIAQRYRFYSFGDAMLLLPN